MILYVYLISSLIVIFFLFIIVVRYIDKNRISDKIKHFQDYVVILEYHMKKAYDIVYKDKILIYSLEATKINDSEFNIVSKEFALLVLKMIGPNLKDEFMEFYGNEETLIFNLIEYFNTNFENDEIREKARENMFNQNDNSPT